MFYCTEPARFNRRETRKEVAVIVQEIEAAPEAALTVSVPAAAKLLGISRNLAFDLVRRGELPATRLGRRLVVSRKALDRLLGDRV